MDTLTSTPTSSPPAAAPALLPSLRRRRDVEQNRGVAAIALSGALSAVVEVDGRARSGDGLARLGMSVRQAWDEAARQLIAAAQTLHGTRFWTRRATLAGALTDGVQIRTDHTDATAWLAHPAPFMLLNDHLVGLLDTPQPVYLAPRPGILLAFPDTPAGQPDRAERDAWLSPQPLVWRRGFPADDL